VRLRCETTAKGELRIFESGVEDDDTGPDMACPQGRQDSFDKFGEAQKGELGGPELHARWPFQNQTVLPGK